MLRTISTLALAGCAAAALNGSALAQDKVTLKFADWMSLSHYTVSHAAVPFMDKVRELSGGNIEILHFPAEQLGKAKDALSLVQSGVADIANISPSYIPDKFVRLPLPAGASVAFRDFVAAHEGAADGRYHYLALPEGRLARRGVTAPLGAIVLLDRRSSGPAEIHAAPERLALKLLARQSVQAAEDARPLLDEMRAIVRRLPCYVLSYADLEDAVALLEAAFARWPARLTAPPPADEAALTRRLLERDDVDTPDDPAEGLRGRYRPGMRLVRNPGVTLHLVDGEAFLAGSGETAAIHHLNAVGTGIWNLLAQPTDEDEAADMLATAFPDVAPRTIARDVAALFASLHASGFAIENVPGRSAITH